MYYLFSLATLAHACVYWCEELDLARLLEQRLATFVTGCTEMVDMCDIVLKENMSHIFLYLSPSRVRNVNVHLIV